MLRSHPSDDEIIAMSEEEFEDFSDALSESRDHSLFHYMDLRRKHRLGL